MGAAWQRGSGQEGVEAPWGSYPAREEKWEPERGPVFTAERWGSPGLPKMTRDAPHLPWGDLAMGWKGWSCLDSSCGVAERSGHFWFLGCGPGSLFTSEGTKRAQRRDLGFL